ncbi:uncharacterized protein LOC128483967 [Spea bombifrons]|uniref:uncharacterized protein LOC128483967 n=1 Tax=Spea bombifrons TaxID=233779 RepID=UPI002349B3DD|nr:uncharacterized protein LOC128483967 [Spea bombifrons]
MEGDGSAERYDMWLSGFMDPRTTERWEPPECEKTLDGKEMTSAPSRCILEMSDEVLLLLMEFLDPFSLLRAGAACSTLYRICSTDSLWAAHCRSSFGSDFRTTDAAYTQKEAFKLLYIWGKLYKTLPYNRPLQDLLFSGIPPKRYWMQWLILEDMVPLPPIQLADYDIEDIWGLRKDLLDEKHKVTDESLEETKHSVFKYDWKELHNLALQHHGTYAKVQLHVLQKMSSECHEELEWLFVQYNRFRFQWLFSYWLFGLSKSCARQLQRIYLWWKRFDKRKVSSWGSTQCDVQYLASLHCITEDFWNGNLANGEENIGIQTIENYFSMCKSLLAWILGRKWGRFKQKKIYKDTLEGVYRVLKPEMQVALISHDQFWAAAKVQMLRICSLEETAGNYVNWKLIDALPCYRLYMASGDPFYLEQIKGFLFRKQLISNWLLQEENMWVRNLLPDSLSQLLEYETKLIEERLHGDTMVAYLSRLIWLYLHSGQQLYMDALKGFVYECAYASFSSQIFESCSIVSTGF